MRGMRRSTHLLIGLSGAHQEGHLSPFLGTFVSLGSLPEIQYLQKKSGHKVSERNPHDSSCPLSTVGAPK